MGSSAAAWRSVFVFAVSVVLGQDDWAVTYTTYQICATEGSTVELRCTYRRPSTVKALKSTVEDRFWVTTTPGNRAVDLRADSNYSGRIQNHCDENSCSLRISDLRASDSAVYKLRFITNRPDEGFTAEPGVTLSVTVLQVQVVKTSYWYPPWARLTCRSSCRLSDNPPFIWYQNGLEIQPQGLYIEKYFGETDSVSCAVRGSESFSPSVCVLRTTCNTVIYSDRHICAFNGSSVDISCTYSSSGRISSRFWFSPDRSLQNLGSDFQFTGRVEVIDSLRGRSTLRISDLRESDSGQYRFKFTTPGFEWVSSLPGTTLTVTDPDPRVQVFWSSAGPKLVCVTSCLPPRRPFVWYKNEKKVQGQTSSTYTGRLDPADSYSCGIHGHEGQHSPPVYAPKVPYLLHTGGFMKDSAVTLTCSSDANPQAQYTWYKENTRVHNEELQLVFRSIQSSDSGEYHCEADNKLGRSSSKSVFIDVQYGPTSVNISVSPSNVVVEGTAVTLACSSDANPAANYTWYMENQTLHHGAGGVYGFTSISSKDRGTYYCQSENQHGHINSTFLLLDVYYPPKLPSVSSSGEIVEGRSVTLTCSSDANPAANYTWYKDNEESPKASGQIFTITDIRPEHSGNYYCEAWNSRGRHNNTVHLTVTAAPWKTAATGTTLTVLLVMMLLAVFLWTRRRDSFTQQPRKEPDSRATINLVPGCNSLTAAAAQEEDLLYARIHFTQNQADVVYSNISSARPHTPTETVEYTAVNVDGSSGASGTTCEDEVALYSTVNKNYTNTT